jgi:hypothetical protein
LFARDGNEPDLSEAGGIFEGIAMGDLGFGEVFRRLYRGFDDRYGTGVVFILRE